MYNNTMIELHAADWFTIKGRGRVASIVEPWTGTGENYSPNTLTGKNVKVDGIEYMVMGAEVYTIACDVNNPYRLRYSLLVKGV